MVLQGMVCNDKMESHCDSVKHHALEINLLPVDQEIPDDKVVDGERPDVHPEYVNIFFTPLLRFPS